MSSRQKGSTKSDTMGRNTTKANTMRSATGGSVRRRKSEKIPIRMIVLISQIGITMMVPVFFCAWLGFFVSQKTGIDFIFLLFLLLGILSGFRSCYSVITRFVSLKNPEDPAPAPQDWDDPEDEED